MPERTKFVVEDNGDKWSVMQSDFSNGTFPHDYHVQLQTPTHSILVDVMSSPGGGYEGGYSATSIKALLSKDPGFVFAIYPEDFVNRIGKLFGMEDVILGYPELDKHVIVKTNDAEKLKGLMADTHLRGELERLSGFSFKIEHEEGDGSSDAWHLHLQLQRAVGSYNELSGLLSCFQTVLNSID